MTDTTAATRRAADLYRQAREAAAQGDQERAAQLRAAADAIFDELEKEQIHA